MKRPVAGLVAAGAFLILLLWADADTNPRWPEIRASHQRWHGLTADLKTMEAPRHLGACRGPEWAVYLRRDVVKLCYVFGRTPEALPAFMDTYGVQGVVMDSNAEGIEKRLGGWLRKHIGEPEAQGEVWLWRVPRLAPHERRKP